LGSTYICSLPEKSTYEDIMHCKSQIIMERMQRLNF